MADYRDIGYVNGGTAATQVVVADPTTQVFKATHDGKGNRLTYMHRSFISFSFGGKRIEDLGLIATTSERIQRQLSAAFDDLVTDYDVVNGQYYWGTRFTVNQLELTLSTDAITEAQLEEVKRLFRGGNIQELILAEHPNRGIYARVANPPVMSVMAFEEKAEKNIMGTIYTTSTTMYRGDISVTLVMDEPYWHAISNIFLANVSDANGKSVSALSDQDTIKTIIEDGIPYYGMLERPTYVGSGLYSKNSTAATASADVDPSTPAYLYYAGSAPATTEIKFTFKPKFNSDKNTTISEFITTTDAVVGTAIVGKTYIGGRTTSTTNSRVSSFYVMEPRNKTYESVWDSNRHVHYNYIQIGTKQFRFTTPSILAAYNNALEVMRRHSGGSIAEILVDMRDSVTEYNTRAWAVAVVNYLASSNFLDDAGTGLIANYGGFTLQYAFNKLMWIYLVDNNGQPQTATVTFNSKDGSATGTFKARRMGTTAWNATTVKAQDDMFGFFSSKSSFITVTENIGNMVYDKYFILDEQTAPNANGTILPADCLKVSTDYTDGLTSLSINYKNMYL